MHPVHAAVHLVEDLPPVSTKLALYPFCELPAAVAERATVRIVSAAGLVPVLQVIKGAEGTKE